MRNTVTPVGRIASVAAMLPFPVPGAAAKHAPENFPSFLAQRFIAVLEWTNAAASASTSFRPLSALFR
jgi:hypothetical protein